MVQYTDKKYKVLTAELMHETNTFSCRPTDIQCFKDCFLLMGTDAITERGQVNTELAGFLDTGLDKGWHINHVISASAGPGGKVTQATYDYLCEPVLAALLNQRFDGILLGLHGAMVTELNADGEGELLRRIRTLVGVNMPIAITLDPHANVTRQMCALADIIVSYKTYPHIDMRDTAKQAAEILHRTMLGEINPVTICVSRPLLEEINGGRTDIGPMVERIAAARQHENQDDVFAVSVNGGFANADIEEVGPTVLVTAQGDLATHSVFADSIADDIWNRRNEVLNDYMSVESAAAVAVDFESRQGPLVIADYADNPGGGAYGDSTELLRAMLDAGVSEACFGPMVDGDTVKHLEHVKVGEQVRVSLGGKTDTRFGGGPLSLVAEIVSHSDGHYVGNGLMIGGLARTFGPTVVLRVDGIEILVVTISAQILDLQQFKTFGINPAQKRVVALKSMQHFRAAFEPIAAKVIVCDSGALCTTNYQIMPYENVRRPIFPLDPEMQLGDGKD